MSLPAAGVLGCSEDIESSEDLYEAVGGVIEGVVGEGEGDIHILCQQLFSIALGYAVCVLGTVQQLLRLYTVLSIIQWYLSKEDTISHPKYHACIHSTFQPLKYRHLTIEVLLAH